MALIKTLLAVPAGRRSIHDEVEATFSTFTVAGRKILQVNSLGRPDREQPGKVSQTIQFDEEGARVLIDLLKREFNLA